MKKVKSHHPYVVSKRNPTQLNIKVKPIISEQLDCSYVACGNVIQIYSLTTGMLINSLRSKRNNIEGNNTLRGDLHKGQIIEIALVNNKILSLCSKGILGEWDAKSGLLLNSSQIVGVENIKLAIINNEYIAIYQQEKQLIRLYDTQTQNIIQELALESKFNVKQMTIQNKILALIQGKHVIVFNLEKGNKKVIQRDSTLKSIALHSQGQMLAVGDSFGKIYIIHNFSNDKQLVIQTLHWHAHSVNTLQFVPNSSYLLSGGEEAVLVQWHLENQSKTFISRVGNALSNICLSEPNMTCYGLLLKDNSFKVVRFDNNKTLINVKHLTVNNDQETLVSRGQLISANDHELQFYNLTQTHKQIQELQVKQRNYVSASDFQKLPQSAIKSFVFTPDQKNLITFEDLSDSNQHNKSIKIQYLKFWNRDQITEDPNDFQLIQVIQDPCLKPKYGMLIESIDNTTIVTSNKNIARIWKYEANRWFLFTEIEYQESEILQLTSNVKLRLKNEKKHEKDQNPKCIALLHKNGTITFWDEQSMMLLHVIKLNNFCTKVIFESSSRYFAGLTINGGVEIWQLSGESEKHIWDLNFKSVTDILSNTSKENQFFITMNSNDETNKQADSILLFQFSRPQNLVMYWKTQVPFMKVLFVDMEPSFLLIVNKNQELQRIYCGVSRTDLKVAAQKRRASLDFKQKDITNQVEQQKQADYHFINQKQERRYSDIKDIDILNKQQENQIKRLDKADQTLTESEFISMPSLSYCLKTFVSEMLIKPSAATNIIDLQSELNQEYLSKNQDEVMLIEKDNRSQKQFYDEIEIELNTMFDQLLQQ